MGLPSSSRLLQSIGTLSLGHQQGGRDSKLCHSALLDTTPNCPADVMITLSLLGNHHCKDQLSTTKSPSTFEYYKNPIVMKQKRTLWVFLPTFSLSFSFSFSKGLQSDLSFGGFVWTTCLDIYVQESKKFRFQRLDESLHCYLKEGIHPRLTRYQH